MQAFWALFVLLFATCVPYFFVIRLFPKEEFCDNSDESCIDFWIRTEYNKIAELFTEKSLELKNRYEGVIHESVPVSAPKLKTRFTYIPGDKKKLMIHVSGTHGVEGYAGSAVQSKLLHNYTFSPDGPQVLLVNLLNPWGLKYGRRYNEHNVDLNRNPIDDEDWKTVLSRGKNEFGYETFYNECIRHGKWLGAIDWPLTIFRSIYCMIKHPNVVPLIMTGQYHRPDASQYGGNSMEKNHANVLDFIHKYIQVDTVEEVGMIDQHTGVGPRGKDTILWAPDTVIPNDLVQKLFSFHEQEDLLKNVRANFSGLELGSANFFDFRFVRGQIWQTYCHMFPATKRICVCQEHGTFPAVLSGLYVAKDARHWQYENKKTTDTLKHVLGLIPTMQWKQDSVRQGIDLFDSIYSELNRE